jgi:hypothetical protein
MREDLGPAGVESNKGEENKHPRLSPSKDLTEANLTPLRAP